MRYEEESSKEDQDERLERFEQMLANDDQYYFDAWDLEDLVEFYLEQFDLNKASKVVDLALNQHPHNTTFELKRAEILNLQGDHKTAMRSIRLLEPIMPNDVDMLMTKADILSHSGKHLQAIKTYDHALDNTSNRSEIRLLISLEYQHLGNVQGALTQLKLALAEDPHNLEIIEELGAAFEMAEATQAAISYFSHFTDKYPYEKNGWFQLALFYIVEKSFDKAIWALEFCLAIDDEHLYAHIEIGDCLQKKEQWSEAEEHFGKILSDNPTSYHGLTGLAGCAQGRKEYEDSFNLYARITDSYPSIAEGWFGLALASECLEHFEQSLIYIDKAIETDPDIHEYWGICAEVRQLLGLFDLALEAWEQACILKPTETRYYVSRARLVFYHFDTGTGIDVLFEAMMINPDSAELQYLAAAFMLVAGQKREALIFLQNGLELDFSKHLLLLAECPEAKSVPMVAELIRIYGQ